MSSAIPAQCGYSALPGGVGRIGAGNVGGRSVAAIASIGLALCTVAFTVGRLTAGRLQGRLPPGTILDAEPAVTLWTPTVPPAFQSEPPAKKTVRRFDLYLINQMGLDNGTVKLANLEQWLAPDFVYETVGFPNSHTLREWCLSGEESQYRTAFPETVFTLMLFLGDATMATVTSYGVALWQNDLFGIPAPRSWVYYSVTDFYSARPGGDGTAKLYYNFMMMDFADLFRQVGRPVLPPAPLPEGIVLPPSVNDGVPAPLSVIAAQRDAGAARKVAEGALFGDWAGDGPAEKWWMPNLTFYGPGGIGLARGSAQYHEHVLAPFRAAFAKRSVEPRIFGCEGNYCAAYGTLKGRHIRAWLGLQPTGRQVSIRFSMHWRIVDGRVQEGWAVFDIPGLFHQLGMDFFELAAEYGRNK